MAATRPVRAMVPKDAPPGKPGDFDFLTGSWKIKNRRLKSPGVWDEFDGESTCFGILGGVVSVEELRIPARDFGGMGLRTLDVQKKVWSDIWMNAKSGVVVSPGSTGYFENGAGIFDEDDECPEETYAYVPARGCDCGGSDVTLGLGAAVILPFGFGLTRRRRPR